MREVYLYQTVHVLDGECLCLREHLAVLDRWSRTLFGCPGPQDAREVGTAVAAVVGREAPGSDRSKFVRLVLPASGSLRLEFEGVSLYRGYDLRSLMPEAVTLQYEPPLFDAPTSAREAAVELARQYAGLQGASVAVRCDRNGTLMAADEAALFAGDLFRMYSRYAEARRWRVEIMSASEGEHGGYKEIIAKISGDVVYGRLKFESGGHRVQRVPATESQGRIHTSACTVAVMPELPDAELPDINPADLRIDTFRSSGAGGQHVNTTDSAIRITHLPTGIVVECQDERSQHKNKAKALSVLGARIHAAEMAKRQQAEASTRRNLLGSGDRSDRNRTYNFPQGRVTDHRINLTLYRLDEVMEGKLDMLIEPIIQEHQADQLAALSEQE